MMRDRPFRVLVWATGGFITAQIRLHFAGENDGMRGRHSRMAADRGMNPTKQEGRHSEECNKHNLQQTHHNVQPLS